MNLRPTYHFMPEKNWMNDPNGPIYYKGEYHLFYQYNPYGDNWGTIHWGHAKSKDLVHWEHLPIALSPSSEQDELHCFSGCCMIDDKGVPTIFYSSIGEGKRHHTIGAEQWIATSKDDMISWEKHPANPVMKVELHGELDIKEWRDPFIWKENGEWFMVLGGSNSGEGCVLIYKSKNLLSWQFLNVLYQSDEYEIIECPNILKFEDKYVLVISPSSDVKYLVGDINEDYTFSVINERVLDYSGVEGFYAPNTLIAPNGEKVTFGWLTENPRGHLKGIEGWAGVHSIPRILTLNSNNELIQKPVEEIKVLRKNEVNFSDVNIEGLFNTDVKGKALEILAEIQVDNIHADFAISVLASKDRKEETLVKISPSKKEFSVDRTKSSISEETHKSELVGRFDFKTGETVKLNMFIDHSTIEVFFNDKETLSTRVYPIKEDSDNVLIIVPKGEIKINYLKIWEMKGIYKRAFA